MIYLEYPPENINALAVFDTLKTFVPEDSSEIIVSGIATVTYLFKRYTAILRAHCYFLPESFYFKSVMGEVWLQSRAYS